MPLSLGCFHHIFFSVTPPRETEEKKIFFFYFLNNSKKCVRCGRVDAHLPKLIIPSTNAIPPLFFFFSSRKDKKCGYLIFTRKIIKQFHIYFLALSWRDIQITTFNWLLGCYFSFSDSFWGAAFGMASNRKWPPRTHTHNDLNVWYFSYFYFFKYDY